MTEEKILTVIDDIKELIRSTKRELETCELYIKRNNCFVTEAKRKTPILQQRIEILEKTLPMIIVNRNKFYPFYADCPKCGWHISMGEHKNFCGYCGQALKWG